MTQRQLDGLIARLDPRAPGACSTAFALALVELGFIDRRRVSITDRVSDTVRSPRLGGEVTADVQLNPDAAPGFAHSLGRAAARAYFAGKLALGGAQ